MDVLYDGDARLFLFYKIAISDATSQAVGSENYNMAVLVLLFLNTQDLQIIFLRVMIPFGSVYVGNV